MMTKGFPIMSTLPEGAETPSACQQYPTLLAVSAAIIAHRDLGALFHELADRLHQVVRFDYLACLLHDATSNTMRPISWRPRNPFRPRLFALIRSRRTLGESSGRPSTP
jgi:hypothetical protein